MNKKGQMTLSHILIAVLCMTILIVLVFIFTGRIGINDITENIQQEYRTIEPSYIDCEHNVICYRITLDSLGCTYIPNISECNDV